MFMRLFIIAITPAISIAYAVYLSDRYDREPISLLFKTFALGALSVIPTIVVERILNGINIFPGILGIAFTSFIIAGFTEEFFKREVVKRLIYHNRHFNEKLDGVVYCIFSALGFATVENIIYVVFRFSFNSYVGLYRGILSVPAHSIFAVTMGYYLSLAKFAKNDADEALYLKKSLYMPLILHGIFDFMLMARIPAFGVVFIPYVIYLWITNQRKLNKYIHESKMKFDIIDEDKYDDEL
ncbi:PrsW family intramembrane metalloprotease [Brassicibacter mesophilus]|uniref:PrsW family intramembrane metalloprotease n=1 Tax=Brassicibacter mesophilus TaxID=745119 RepID=UPI003D19F454